MAKIWVRCLTIVHVEEGGKRKPYYPGDWCQIGKHYARQLIADGRAEIPDIQKRSNVLALYDCGVVSFNNSSTVQRLVEASYPGLDVVEFDYTVPFPRTMYLDGNLPFKPRMLPTGFGRLEFGWQLAIPIKTFGTLAKDVGTQEERDYTKTIVRDLTMPIKDTRLMFARRCDTIIELLEQWKNEKAKFGDTPLAFLRAWYTVKPITCDLPALWLGE